jgi:hypothetical protein
MAADERYGALPFLLKEGELTVAKKLTKQKPAKFEAEPRSWLMLQGDAEGAPIQVAPGLKLIGATRNPYTLRLMIAEGKFGDKLGRSLLTLVPEPNGQPIKNHEFRLIQWRRILVCALFNCRGWLSKARAAWL